MEQINVNTLTIIAFSTLGTILAMLGGYYIASVRGAIKDVARIKESLGLGNQRFRWIAEKLKTLRLHAERQGAHFGEPEWTIPKRDDI